MTNSGSTPAPEFLDDTEDVQLDDMLLLSEEDKRAKEFYAGYAVAMASIHRELASHPHPISFEEIETAMADAAADDEVTWEQICWAKDTDHEDKEALEGEYDLRELLFIHGRALGWQPSPPTPPEPAPLIITPFTTSGGNRGHWGGKVQYVKGDTVWAQNRMWVCLVDHTSPIVFDGNARFWTELVKAEDGTWSMKHALSSIISAFARRKRTPLPAVTRPPPPSADD